MVDICLVNLCEAVVALSFSSAAVVALSFFSGAVAAPSVSAIIVDVEGSFLRKFVLSALDQTTVLVFLVRVVFLVVAALFLSIPIDVVSLGDVRVKY